MASVYTPGRFQITETGERFLKQDFAAEIDKAGRDRYKLQSRLMILRRVRDGLSFVPTEMLDQLPIRSKMIDKKSVSGSWGRATWSTLRKVWWGMKYRYERRSAMAPESAWRSVPETIVRQNLTTSGLSRLHAGDVLQSDFSLYRAHPAPEQPPPDPGAEEVPLFQP